MKIFTLLRKPFTMLGKGAKRFPLLAFAVILGAAMVGASVVFAHKVRQSTTAPAGFDVSTVLPQAVVPQNPTTAVFNAESIKQYDGKSGHKCYVAVDGTVYEIAGKPLWQNGQHSPSNGQAYCGADMSEAIKKSPHGTSKLAELPKVGTYK